MNFKPIRPENFVWPTYVLYEPAAGCRQPVNDLVTAKYIIRAPFSFLLSTDKISIRWDTKKKSQKGHFKPGIKSEWEIHAIPRGMNWFISAYGDSSWLSSHQVMPCHVFGSGAHDRQGHPLPIAILFFSPEFSFHNGFPMNATAAWIGPWKDSVTNKEHILACNTKPT